MNYPYYLREHSSFSSNIQNESTSRMSRSDLKNIAELKKNMNIYKRKRNKKDNINNRNSYIKISKLHLNNNNFYSTYLKEKFNIQNKILNYKDNVKSDYFKIKTRNQNKYSFHKKINLSYDKNNEQNKILYKSRFKIEEPFYRYFRQRNKSYIDFNNDTRKIRYLKINSYYGKKEIDKRKDNLLYNRSRTEINEYNYKKINSLIKIYNETLYNYIIYLHIKRNDEFIINYNLSNKRILLIKEIINIKNEINKTIVLFENNLEIKFFLICIKECSVDYKSFNKEIQIEILYDLYKLYIYKKVNNEFFLYNNINNENDNDIYSFYNFINYTIQNINDSFDSNKRIMFLNYILMSLDMKNFFNIFSNINNSNIKSHKLNNIFILKNLIKH